MVMKREREKEKEMNENEQELRRVREIVPPFLQIVSVSYVPSSRPALMQFRFTQSRRMKDVSTSAR